MAVKTYDPKKVFLIVNGAQMTGFVDGTAISFERNEDAFTFQPNLDGGGTRSKSNNKSAKVKFNLMQTSGSNDTMSAFALLDETTAAGLLTLMVRDGNGRTLAAAESAWIMKVPNAEYSKAASGREWTLETDSLEIFLGGN